MFVTEEVRDEPAIAKAAGSRAARVVDTIGQEVGLCNAFREVIVHAHIHLRVPKYENGRGTFHTRGCCIVSIVSTNHLMIIQGTNTLNNHNERTTHYHGYH